MYNQWSHQRGTNSTASATPIAKPPPPSLTFGKRKYYVNTFLLIWSCFFIAKIPEHVLAIPSKYETAYACEGKTLTIECEAGDLINLIRANYGRFSITICNDHGNVDWSVNCMSAKSLRVLHSKCAHKQNCSVLASTNMFGDPCPGTHKYLEAHYQCVSAAQTSTTTTRPSPPWLITSQPSVWSTSTVRLATTQRIAAASNVDASTVVDVAAAQPKNEKNNAQAIATINSKSKPTTTTTAPKQRLAAVASTETSTASSATNRTIDTTEAAVAAQPDADDDDVTDETTSVPGNGSAIATTYATQASVLLNHNHDNYFCGPRTARNLFWNLTRVGEVNVQPCPGGATGIAKWKCVYVHGHHAQHHYGRSALPASTSSVDQRLTQSSPEVVWQPATPDLTHCRSLWLNSLEVRVNHRDSSVISIATDLSQVTSSKTLYGGDMLVTTKIIQTMSEKMTYDIETFPDQRQREAIVQELLHGVVKTGSNLLDAAQHLSWLDLSFEDQMRVATSLLTGIEDNAFLLADTMNRERNVVQKVKNILLSVRVLETRNIVGNEIFPDPHYEQWPVSDDIIELPRGALIENNEGGLVRIVFVAFDRLESILKPAVAVLTSSASVSADGSWNGTQPIVAAARSRVINSKVISASLGKGRHIQLSQPIRLVMRHLKTENVTNPTCVFWNYIDHAWSEDGCHLEATNRTHTICTCNHLTNFAILMDVTDDTAGSLLAIFDDQLRILIYVSIAVCIVLIGAALLTMRLFGGVFVKVSRNEAATTTEPVSDEPSTYHRNNLVARPNALRNTRDNGALDAELDAATTALSAVRASSMRVHHHLHHHLHVHQSVPIATAAVISTAVSSPAHLHQRQPPSSVQTIRNNLDDIRMRDFSV